MQTKKAGQCPAFFRPQIAAIISGIFQAALKTGLPGIGQGDCHPILESFVIQQIRAQADLLEEPVRLSHYRDKDQVEVDLVIEQSRNVYGIEIKKAASIQAKDGEGLARLANKAGRHFKGGALIYCGNNALPLNIPHCIAVPIHGLWQNNT